MSVKDGGIFNTLSSGELLHLSFDGGSVVDSSPSGLTPTITGTLVYTEDKDEVPNGAVESSGTSYITFPDLFTGLTTASIELWFYASASASGSVVMSIGSSPTDSIPNLLLCCTGGLGFNIYRAGNYCDAFTAVAGWNCLIIDTSGLEVNGSIISTTGFTWQYTGRNLYLLSGFGGIYTHPIDEVRVHNRVLTKAEKAEFRSLGVNYTDITDTLAVGRVAYWRFKGDLLDNSGNNKTLIGIPTYGIDKDGIDNSCIVGNNILGLDEMLFLKEDNQPFAFYIFFEKNTETSQQVLIGNGQGGGNNGFFLDKIDGTWVVRCNGGEQIPLNFTENEWNSFVVSYNGTTLKVRANGIEILNIAKSLSTVLGLQPNPPYNRFAVGGYSNRVSYPYLSKYDEVGVYSRSLTDSEMILINTLGVNYNTDTLDIGLIGKWRFQNGDLSDQSGNGRDLVCVGTQVNATDKDGIANNAVDLYNSSYYKTNDLTHPLYGLPEWSICMWVNFRSWITHEGFLTINPDGGGYNGTWFADSADTMNVNQLSIPRPANGWHFVIWEKLSTDDCKFYIDGVAYNINTLSIISTNDLVFGKRASFPNRNPNADFDEISMYNRVLTADERAQLLARGVNYTSDNTPPSLNSVSIDTITETTANLNVNSSEDGKVYYKILSRNATAPTSADIKANPNGQANVTANTTSIISLTGLTSNANLDCYVVAEDTVPNLQPEPTKIELTTPSTGGSSDTLAEGLIGHWSFNGDLLDSSGNNKTLLVGASSNFATDKDGNPNSCMGANSYLGLDEKLILNVDNEPFSYCIWFEKNTSGSTQVLIGNGTHTWGGCYIQQQGGLIAVTADTHQYSISNAASIPDGWNFISVTYDGNILKAKLNNVLKFNEIVNIGMPEGGYQKFAVGCYTDRMSFPWESKYDEVRVYNRALTDEEETLIYSRGVNNNPDTAPPSFNSISIDTITYNSANLNVNSNEDGTVYYKVLARDATAPTSEELKSAPYVPVIAGTTSIIPISNLVNNTLYDIYVIGEDARGNTSEITKLQFLSGLAINDGLEAYYRFSNKLLDSSGNGRDLTTIGTVNFVADKDGVQSGAVSFEGAGNSLETAYPNTPASPCISAWVKDTTLTPYSSAAFLVSINGIEQFWQGFTLAFVSEKIGFTSNINGQRYVGVKDISDNNWHHCVVQFDDTTKVLKFYVDKILVYKTTYTGSIEYSATRKIQLGVASTYPNESNDYLDEVRIYSRNLTDGGVTTVGEVATGEIAQLFDMGVEDDTYVTVDTVSPVLSGTLVDVLSPTTANLNVVSDEGATVYYKVLLKDSTAPTSTEIKSSPTGTSTLSAGVSTIISLSTLLPKTAYDIYVVGEDTAGNISVPIKSQFTTQSLGVVDAPSSDVVSGTYNTSKLTTLSTVLEGTTIKYTLDGTEPSDTNGTVYTDPINITSSTTIKFMASKEGYDNSTISSTTIELKVVSPAIDKTGEFIGKQLITLSCSDTEAGIYYSIDSSESPDGTTLTGSILYTAPFELSTGEYNIKVVAIREGYTKSDVVSSSVIIEPIPKIINTTDPIQEYGKGKITFTLEDSQVVGNVISPANIKYLLSLDGVELSADDINNYSLYTDLSLGADNKYTITGIAKGTYQLIILMSGDILSQVVDIAIQEKLPSPILVKEGMSLETDLLTNPFNIGKGVDTYSPVLDVSTRYPVNTLITCSIGGVDVAEPSFGKVLSLVRGTDDGKEIIISVSCDGYIPNTATYTYTFLEWDYNKTTFKAIPQTSADNVKLQSFNLQGESLDYTADKYVLLSFDNAVLFDVDGNIPETGVYKYSWSEIESLTISNPIIDIPSKALKIYTQVVSLDVDEKVVYSFNQLEVDVVRKVLLLPSLLHVTDDEVTKEEVTGSGIYAESYTLNLKTLNHTYYIKSDGYYTEFQDKLSAKVTLNSAVVLEGLISEVKDTPIIFNSVGKVEVVITPLDDLNEITTLVEASLPVTSYFNVEETREIKVLPVISDDFAMKGLKFIFAVSLLLNGRKDNTFDKSKLVYKINGEVNTDILCDEITNEIWFIPSNCYFVGSYNILVEYNSLVSNTQEFIAKAVVRKVVIVSNSDFDSVISDTHYTSSILGGRTGMSVPTIAVDIQETHPITGISYLLSTVDSEFESVSVKEINVLPGYVVIDGKSVKYERPNTLPGNIDVVLSVHYKNLEIDSDAIRVEMKDTLSNYSFNLNVPNTSFVADGLNSLVVASICKHGSETVHPTVEYSLNSSKAGRAPIKTSDGYFTTKNWGEYTVTAKATYTYKDLNNLNRSVEFTESTYSSDVFNVTCTAPSVSITASLSSVAVTHGTDVVVSLGVIVNGNPVLNQSFQTYLAKQGEDNYTLQSSNSIQTTEDMVGEEYKVKVVYMYSSSDGVDYIEKTSLPVVFRVKHGELQVTSYTSITSDIPILSLTANGTDTVNVSVELASDRVVPDEDFSLSLGTIMSQAKIEYYYQLYDGEWVLMSSPVFKTKTAGTYTFKTLVSHSSLSYVVESKKSVVYNNIVHTYIADMSVTKSIVTPSGSDYVGVVVKFTDNDILVRGLGYTLFVNGSEVVEKDFAPKMPGEWVLKAKVEYSGKVIYSNEVTITCITVEPEPDNGIIGDRLVFTNRCGYGFCGNFQQYSGQNGFIVGHGYVFDKSSSIETGINISDGSVTVSSLVNREDYTKSAIYLDFKTNTKLSNFRFVKKSSQESIMVRVVDGFIDLHYRSSTNIITIFRKRLSDFILGITDATKSLSTNTYPDSIRVRLVVYVLNGLVDGVDCIVSTATSKYSNSLRKVIEFDNVGDIYQEVKQEYIEDIGGMLLDFNTILSSLINGITISSNETSKVFEYVEFDSVLEV